MRTLSIVSAILVLLISVGWGSSQPAFAAAAPIATFGDGAIEPSRSSLNSNQMTLLRVQVPSSGIITKLSVYTARLSGSPVLTGVVYADNDGIPGGFLGKTSEVAVANALTSPAWLDLPGPNIPISAGYVWIGLMVGPSTGSHSAAFWINLFAPPYRLDSNIFVTYPNAPATATGYNAWTDVSWSITGTLGTVTPLTVSVAPTSANLEVGSDELTVGTAVGLSTFEATDVDSHGNVFAGYNYGVYKSTDHGNTFSLIFADPTQPNPAPVEGMTGHLWTVYVDSRDYVFISVISTNRLF